MGIYDRDYYRDPPTASARAGRVGRLGVVSVNTWLIVINVAVFALGVALGTNRAWLQPVLVDQELKITPPVVQEGSVWRDPATGIPLDPAAWRPGMPVIRLLADSQGIPIGQNVYVVMEPLNRFGHFSTALGFFKIELWRLISFQFLHANWVHLAMNMFGLWVFGGMVEEVLGSKRYAAFYLMCGICGALSYIVLNFLGAVAGLRWPGVLVDSVNTPLVGASAGVFGVIMACAYIAPNSLVQLLFPPVLLKLKWMAYGFVGIAAGNLLFQGRNAGGDAAHIGGAIAGAFFIRNSHLLRDFFDIFGDSRPTGRRRPRGAGPTAEDDAEVDRILDKVRESGVGGLTDDERESLKASTERRRE